MNDLINGYDVAVRIWCSDQEQASVNTVWYRVAAVGSPAATDQDLANFLEPILAPDYKVILYNGATFNGVQVQQFNPLQPYRAVTAEVFNNADAGVGTGGEFGLPRQTCGLGSFQSNLPGPANRGRIYFPFPAAEGGESFGKPTALYVTNIGIIAAELATGLALSDSGRTATLVRVIRHKGSATVVAPFPTHVTGSTVATKWATQRRRGSFGRANVSPI